MEINHDFNIDRLIIRCRKKDSKAQFELYKIYATQIYNTCFRIVKNTMEAEDVMQESFLTAFKKIDTYKGEVPIGAWLRRIAVNKSLDVLRKRKIEFSICENFEDKPDDEPQDYPLLNMKQIKNCIMDLPDKYRTVLTLYLIEGYDHQEICDIVGISSGTVRSQYARAKKKLELIIKEKIKTVKNEY